MKRVVPLAAALVLGLVATEPVLAQSTLKRLEEMIRATRPDAAAGTRPTQTPEAGPAAQAAATKPNREKGYLGIITDDRKDRGRGVRILEVRPASPADIGGLKPQDLITAAGEMRVRQMDDLADVLEEMAPGDVLEFSVLRNERPRKIAVTFGRLPPPTPGQAERVVTPPPEAGGSTPFKDDLELTPPAIVPKLAQPPGAKPSMIQPGDSPLKPPAMSDRELIESLQRRVEQLERRVKELERQLRQRP